MVWGDMGWLLQKLPGTDECASFLPQCKTKMEACLRHQQSSYPAHAGYPVRRGFSDQSSASLEYWIARSSRAMTAEQASAFPRQDFARDDANLVGPLRTEGAGKAGRR